MKIGKFLWVKKKCNTADCHNKFRYLGYSASCHLIILALFLSFFPGYTSQKKEPLVLAVYLEKPTEKKLALPITLPAATFASAKKPQFIRLNAIKKPELPVVRAAIKLDNTEHVPTNAAAKNEPNAVITRKLPILLNEDQVTIPYPRRALQFMIEGVVRLRLTVSEFGVVTHVKILSGPQFGLQNAALLLARKLIFLPATDEEGRALASDIVHDVVFKLKS